MPSVTTGYYELLMSFNARRGRWKVRQTDRQTDRQDVTRLSGMLYGRGSKEGNRDCVVA